MIPVEKNKEYYAEIESVSNDGNGVAHIDGFTVFVPMCADGDKLKIKIVKVKDTYAFGRIEEIITPSPYRREPICPHYKRCGGCNLMHIDYGKQLEIKLNSVKNALSRIGGIDGNIVSDIIGMENPYHYRNKMVFPVDIVAGKTEFGFYANRSHDLIPVDKCFISHEISVPVINTVKKYMDLTNTSVYNEKTHKGTVRRLFIRKGFSAGDVTVILCCANECLIDKDLLVSLLKESCAEISSIVLNINKKPDNLVLGKKNILLWGKEHIEDSLCGLRYKISPHSFFQVNPIQTEILYNTAIQMSDLSGTEKLLDIYSGIGTISLTASRFVSEVIGIEVVEQAVLDATENAKLNKANNCRFFAGKAENIVPRLMSEGFCPDVAIIDPPRKGSDENTLRALAYSSVKKIIYISCNPSTLARDIKYLSQNGFAVQKAMAVDMFPHTSHVEAAVSLCRANT
ncbi:MAG: 23S rRNA (uracil(1939)-C(5))-methyltransferase RlmD [Oscillospiraceae bacterium]|nr:23S rRNA (uracil(1939)-C(5))-methyltransferase RlmD [Oscillospiraceae bacterium]